LKESSKNDYFRQERREVEEIVPKDAKRILDVGCGEGILGRRLLAKGASEVVGIEIARDVCNNAKQNLTSVICGDIEEIALSFDEGYFDCMIFADILEHLKDPLSLLIKLRQNLSDSGVVVASIPNVRYYGIIGMLAEGRWRYEDYGILDKTHLRFFTKKEIEILFTDAGFEITGITANSDPAYDHLSDPYSGEITFGRVTLKALTPEEIRDLFVVQYIIRAQKAGHELTQVNSVVNAVIESGEIEKAKQKIEDYLKLHPVDKDMLYNHAEICCRLGCNDEAMESLRKILLFYPGSEDAMNLMEAIYGNGIKDVVPEDSGHQQRPGSLEKKIESKIKKVAIVRGANLNKWEMQNYEPLSDSYGITAYTTSRTCFNISKIKLPVVQLPFQSKGLLLEMQGLEDHLADKDIVYSADITFKFSAQAVQAKQKFGNKVVCLQWENIPFNYEEYDEVRNIKEIVRNGADHFIAVTERAKETLILEGVSEEKIDVIPMGIDLNRFRPDEPAAQNYSKELGIGSDEIVVLYIGRMVWEKGVYDFVHAARRILWDRAIGPIPVRFIMAGSGQELEAVRERADRLGILKSMIFLKHTPYQDIHKLHNLADIFVLPSIPLKKWQEQFGMVLIESMACGTPVISTLSGSIPEVVGDAGILIQPNDHLSLYEAIKKLILDKELRDILGKKALARAGSYFDSRKNAEKFRMVFEKVMSTKTREDTPKAVYI
jgi:glycosyltransferase involved in cell wall biosynthesis/2-polyprenyl-3-methyl-5-hydroxy-6-metoxy-1,4-benzoquinol methylase